MSFDDLVKILSEKSGKASEEILEMIDKKLESLDGLITKEGAAYLVAKDLGVDLPNKRRKIKIEDIIPGVRNISFIGRVFEISPIREFERANGKGRVVNVYIGDETGFIRLPLWNDQVDWVEDGRISVGQVVQVVNAISRENIYGNPEIFLGKFGAIRLIEDTGEIPSTDVLKSRYRTVGYERIDLKNIRQGRFEITGTIVHVFKSSFIFETDEKSEIMIPTIVDDSTGTIRVTFFRNVAEDLLGMTPDELSTLSEKDRQKEVERRLLGLELKIKGRVKKNVEYDRLEMIANSFEHLNPKEESKKLLEEMANEEEGI